VLCRARSEEEEEGADEEEELRRQHGDRGSVRMYVYVVWQHYCMCEIGRRGEVAARTAVESAVDCTAEEQEQSNRTDPVVGVSSSFRHAIGPVATSIRRHDGGNARRFVG